MRRRSLKIRTRKACVECRSIVAKGNVCPNCGSTKLTDKLEGYVAILDPTSKLAEMLGTEEGEFAVAVM